MFRLNEYQVPITDHHVLFKSEGLMKQILFLGLILLASFSVSADVLSTCNVSYGLIEDQSDSIFYYQVEKYDPKSDTYTTIFQQACDEPDKLNDIVKNNCSLINLDGVRVISDLLGLKLSLACG